MASRPCGPPRLRRRSFAPYTAKRRALAGSRAPQIRRKSTAKTSQWHQAELVPASRWPPARWRSGQLQANFLGQGEVHVLLAHAARLDRRAVAVAQVVQAILHDPFRSAGAGRDEHRFITAKPSRVDIAGMVHEV